MDYNKIEKSPYIKNGRLVLDVNNLIYINYLDEAAYNNSIKVGSTVLVVTQNHHYQCYGENAEGRIDIGNGRYLQKTNYLVFNDDSVVENGNYDPSIGDNIPVGYKTFMKLVEKVNKLGSSSGGGETGGN